MEKPIIFTNLPHREELCHILVSIDPYEKKDKSVKSDFQWQLLKTRLLLFSEVNVIASPAAGLLRYIHVISRRDCLHGGFLNPLFQKLKLKVESVGALSFSIYEQCLIYNLLVKLSPLWNKVEKYFVEGKYFLMHRGALHAIELNIILKGEMLMLYASPLRLWLREVSLFDLLPSSNIEETLSKPFYIDLHSEPQWVHVLPSFKRGHLIYVTNRIPKDSTFEDYQQMRRHWKNTYGYRLPEDDSYPIYVGISFFGNNDFLYPLECVRRGMHMNMDQPNVVAKFAKAVAAKAAIVCGNQIKLLNLTELQNMPKIKISERLKWSESGLAELDSELLNKWLFQSEDSMNLTFESQNVSLYTQQEQIEMPFQTIEDDHNQKRESDWLTKCSQFIEELTKGGQKISFLKASRPACNEASLTLPLTADLKRPSLSTFNKIEGSILLNKESDQNHTQIKPLFNKIGLNFCAKIEPAKLLHKEQQNANKTMDNCDGAIFENNFGLKNEISLVNVVLSGDIPFKPVFKKKKSLHSKRAVKTFEEKKKKFSSSACRSKSMTSKSCMNVKKDSSNEEIIKKRKKKKTEKINHENALENKVTSKHESNVISNFDEYPLIDLARDAVLEEDKDKINSLGSEIEALPVVYENKNNDITKQNVVKRSNTPTSAPKERKKSILLTTIEIENLVFTNQLEKANVPSLCFYLKGRGVSFSKDRKKDALLEKVKELIMLEKRE